MKINFRTIGFGAVIVICIVAINYAIYWQFFRDSTFIPKQEEPPKNEISNTELAQNFHMLFTNSLNYQNNTVKEIAKIQNGKDIVYSNVTKKEKIDNRYDININIPYVNIANETIKKFNEKVDEVFYVKANDIIATANNNTIYSVEYAGFINANILSLVIKSTLKEGNNPQRVIVQTYNYNLSTNEELSLNQILEIKTLQASVVEREIKATVTEANKQAETLKQLGYRVYTRDLNSNIYKIENTSSYFLGENGKLYIVYPYGNSNLTSEMDIIVL